MITIIQFEQARPLQIMKTCVVSKVDWNQLSHSCERDSARI